LSADIVSFHPHYMRDAGALLAELDALGAVAAA
jgi:hypothetical protein